MVIRIFSRQHFGRSSRNFLKIIGVLIGAIVDLGSVNAGALGFSLEPDASQRDIGNYVVLSFAASLSALGPVSSIGLSTSIPLSVKQPIVSSSVAGIVTNDDNSTSSDTRAGPDRLRGMIRGGLIGSLRVAFSRLNPLPPK